MQGAESIVKIPVLWRGKKFIVEMNSGASVHDFGNELQKLTDVKADTMRLIVPQFSSKSSKLLYPFSDEHSCLSFQEVHINESKSIRMMGVLEVEVDEVLENAKADLRIAGFDEEDKRLHRRMLASHDGPIKLPQGPYVFVDFRTLHIPGVELNPSASEAMKRMHRLAADPGIVAIMNKHRWRVGIMTEMAPVGYVGVSPKCILGLNKNRGEEISLRLRTDDLKGFRKYESIKKTLLHELAHMVYSEHDANFYALDKQLNQEAASLDWTRSQGRTLGSFSHSDYDEDDYYVGDVSRLPKKLGGNTSDQMASARASSVAAAYRRMENAFFSNEGVHGMQAEPDPDDCGFNGVETLPNPGKVDIEPDPDDRVDEWRNYEPDPDESHGTDPPKGTITCDELTHSVLPLSADSRMSEEPDPDDSNFIKDEVSVVPLRENSGMIDSMNGLQPREMEEPDPDESGKQNELEIRSIRKPLMETMEEQPCDQASKSYELSHSVVVQRDTGMLAEPDPDDSLRQLDELSEMHIEEPYPDDQDLARIQDPVTALCNRMQKAIKVLQQEVDPMEATKVLQTLVKIIGNVLEHPDDKKFKQLRKGNPVIQRNIANHKAAMEILALIGFNEDVIADEIGKVETYLVLKRNDPGLLWLAKSSIETVMAY